MSQRPRAGRITLPRTIGARAHITRIHIHIITMATQEANTSPYTKMVNTTLTLSEVIKLQWRTSFQEFLSVYSSQF